MPKKETPESIEAELNATQMERLLRELREVVRQIEEFEADLQERERAKGIKTERHNPS